MGHEEHEIHDAFMARFRELSAEFTRIHEAWQGARDRGDRARQATLIAFEQKLVCAIQEVVAAFEQHFSGRDAGGREGNSREGVQEHTSPKTILLAKPETRTIQGRHARVNSVCQSGSSREHDFGSGITYGPEP